MPTITCAVCRREFEGAYVNRQYCSAACKSKAWRAKKKAELASKAPSNAALLARLQVYDPVIYSEAKAILEKAGADCTEPVIRLIGVVLKRKVVPMN